MLPSVKFAEDKDISCRYGHWAVTNHLSGHGLVQWQGGVPEGAVH